MIYIHNPRLVEKADRPYFVYDVVGDDENELQDAVNCRSIIISDKTGDYLFMTYWSCGISAKLVRHNSDGKYRPDNATMRHYQDLAKLEKNPLLVKYYMDLAMEAGKVSIPEKLLAKQPKQEQDDPTLPF